MSRDRSGPNCSAFAASSPHVPKRPRSVGWRLTGSTYLLAVKRKPSQISVGSHCGLFSPPPLLIALAAATVAGRPPPHWQPPPVAPPHPQPAPCLPPPQPHEAPHEQGSLISGCTP